MAAPSSVEVFPVEGLMPKTETGALDFVLKNSEADGRGVVVGILDTGVDPGALGLQVTTDGKPKVIDVIDCSGSGDVDTSTVVTAADDVTVRGLTGRTLTLNPSWSNPTGKWHIGVKSAFELYPRALTSRVKEERKKVFMQRHRAAQAASQEALRQIQQSSTPSTPEQTKTLSNLQDTVDALSELEKSYNDPGPVYDVLAFHDGTHWRAVVDTTETGNVSELPPMCDYRLERQYRRLSDLDTLNYSINVYDEGNVVSIVVDAGAHGTHVAGIVAAYFPEAPELNGVAPGAQIVSLKIGDSRLGSMETGVGLTRALYEAKRRGCDIINMSYGEATSVCNSGRFISVASELVYKHGVFFIASAGNNGPCLCTVGAPGGTSSPVLGVAAYVNENMSKGAYSLAYPPPSGTYTWSSVGPSFDGSMGVSLTAPGGAIAPVPNWTLQKNQLMNGTSMSSPNCTGCAALVISGIKNLLNVKVQIPLLRRALENTAAAIANVEKLSQGHGMVQVGAAFEYIQRYHTSPLSDVNFKIEVQDDGETKRGIFLRQQTQVRVASSYTVKILPEFHEDTPSEAKISFEVRLCLQASASWITCPAHHLLMNNGRDVTVYVDPTGLPPGVHVEFVRGYDTSRGDLDQLFAIPVVALVPHHVLPAGSTSLELGVLDLSPGERIRKLIVPPPGCTWMDVVLEDMRTVGVDERKGEDSVGLVSEDDNSRMIVLHALQLHENTPYSDHEKQFYLRLRPGDVSVKSVPVDAGMTLECCFARFWSTHGPTHVKVRCEFRGLTPAQTQLWLHGGEAVKLVSVSAQLCTTDMAPSAKLNKWWQKAVPVSHSIVPLGERDVMFDGSATYMLRLDYEFDQTEAEDVTVRWPGLNGVLYESGFESQFAMMYDGSKKLLGTSDAFPSSIKITKGKNHVMLYVRHERIATLQGLKGLVMMVERPLKGSKEVSLSWYKTKEGAMFSKSSLESRRVPYGTEVRVFVKEPSDEQLPKKAQPGDILFGQVIYERKVEGLLGSRVLPGGWPLAYVVGPRNPNPNPTTAPSSSDSTEELEPEEQLRQWARDAHVTRLRALVGTPKFLPLYAIVHDAHPEHLPLRRLKLTHVVKLAVMLPTKPLAEEECERLREVIIAADDVMQLIDTQRVAATLGVLPTPEDKERAKAREQAEEEKKALAEALTKKCEAMLALQGSATVAEATEAVQRDLDEALKQLQLWADINAGDPNLKLCVEVHKRAGRWGSVLKRLLGATDKYVVFDQIIEALGELGWEHAKENLKHNKLIDAPPAYAIY